MSVKYRPRPNRTRPNNSPFSFTRLESRRLLASIYHDPSGGLWIVGDSENNVGEVSVSDGQLSASVDDASFAAPSSSVTDIVFIGYDGDDTFINNSARSVAAHGNRGNDRLVGGGGADVLVGGPGNDVVDGKGGDDRIIGAGGNDVLDGGNGNDRIFGSLGKNTIHGGNGNDVIFGSNDADTIHGDAGIDKIYALGGDDWLYSGSGGVEGSSAEQGDLVMGHDGNDTIIGTDGLDIFYGGLGNDVLTGGTGENRLHGQNGNDTLRGDGANDYLDAGGGTDTAIYTGDYDYRDVRVQENAFYVGIKRVKGAEWVEFDDRTISTDQAVYSTASQNNFSHLNNYRIGQDRIQLSKPQDLADYARNWSLTMSRTDTLEHSDYGSLLGNGRRTVGENVIFADDTGQSEEEIALIFHDAWRNSASHNANMLNNSFSEVGIGIIKRNGAWWGTQIFAG